MLVLKNCGPKGYPGFPEVGNFALPAKILKQGVTDMVRICDARMSGTAYGTVVLHTAPEAAAGGPLALVRNGDLIEIDVAKRRIQLHVTDAELEAAQGQVEAAAAARDARVGEALLRHGAAGGSRRGSRFSRRQVRRQGRQGLALRCAGLDAAAGLGTPGRAHAAVHLRLS